MSLMGSGAPKQGFVAPRKGFVANINVWEWGWVLMVMLQPRKYIEGHHTKDANPGNAHGLPEPTRA